MVFLKGFAAGLLIIVTLVAANNQILSTIKETTLITITCTFQDPMFIERNWQFTSLQS
jgi:hypothetical protein